jgi:hypothetical protein
MNEWRPHPGPQTEALSRSEFEILYGGARGGGKTDAGFAWLAEPEYISHERFRGLVIRKNSTDLSDWIARAKIFYKSIAVVKGNPPVIHFHAGGTVATGHLKDENAYDKYHGHEYQKILIEELTQIPSEDRYLKLVSTARSSVPGLVPQIFATTNPGNVGHLWVKTRWVDVARSRTYFDPVSKRSRIFIPAKVDDNPALVKNDPAYVRFLDSLPEKLRMAWRHGSWDVFEGQFFDEFKSEIHVVKPFEVPREWSRFVAIDYGTRNPFSAHWYAVDYEGIVYCYREIYESGLNAKMQARSILKATQPGEQISAYIADPSMWAKTQTVDTRLKNFTLESIADQYRQAGIILTPANNDRLNGCNMMRQYLAWEGEFPTVSVAPKLFFFQNCRNMIRTLPALVHDDKKPELYDTDGEDHAADDLRYALMHIEKPEKENAEEKKEAVHEDEVYLEDYLVDDEADIR